MKRNLLVIKLAISYNRQLAIGRETWFFETFEVIEIVKLSLNGSVNYLAAATLIGLFKP